MSPALLSKRLQMLVRAGVVERWADGNRVTYRLSPSGKELEPIVEALGRWGIRWVPELGDADLDPHLLLWDVHRNVDTEAVPDGRTAIGFEFPEVEPALRRWWIVVTGDGVDVCDEDPGFRSRRAAARAAAIRAGSGSRRGPAGAPVAAGPGAR